MALERLRKATAVVATSATAAAPTAAAANTIKTNSQGSETDQGKAEILDPSVNAVQLISKLALRNRITYVADHTKKQQPKKLFAGGYGGYEGTGFSKAEINNIKHYSGETSDFTGGHGFLVTTYGPPWSGIEGTGVTSTGIDLVDRKVHEVAVDPGVIPYGTLVSVWPNALHYRGPFVAADSGGDIVGDHVDVEDPIDGGTSTASFYNATVSDYEVHEHHHHHRPQPRYVGVLGPMVAFEDSTK